MNTEDIFFLEIDETLYLSPYLEFSFKTYPYSGASLFTASTPAEKIQVVESCTHCRGGYTKPISGGERRCKSCGGTGKKLF